MLAPCSHLSSQNSIVYHPNGRLLKPRQGCRPAWRQVDRIKIRSPLHYFLALLHVSKYKNVLKQFPLYSQCHFRSNRGQMLRKTNYPKGIKQQYQEAMILDSMNNGRWRETLNPQSSRVGSWSSMRINASW